MVYQPYSSHEEDAVLVRAYRTGDEQSFALLLNKHLGAVYSFVFQLVQDRAAAEDVVQEVFVKAWRHLGRFDVTRPFRTWLFAIAKNSAYDWLKKKRAIPFSAFAIDEAEEPFENIPDTEPLPNELLIQEGVVHEVREAVACLHEPYRSLMVLVYQEGFSLHEASEVLGESYNTVKSRHQRAIARLRQRFTMDASKNQ
ncbi:MAG: RNA polymerase sigma factor [Candidatus Moraniibacteriota bacterium]